MIIHNEIPKKEIKDGSVDAGLKLLRHYRHPGGRMTLREIAEVCGCHHNRICIIEQQALKKLQHRLHAVLAELKG